MTGQIPSRSRFSKFEPVNFNKFCDWTTGPDTVFDYVNHSLSNQKFYFHNFDNTESIEQIYKKSVINTTHTLTVRSVDLTCLILCVPYALAVVLTRSDSVLSRPVERFTLYTFDFVLPVVFCACYVPSAIIAFVFIAPLQTVYYKNQNSSKSSPLHLSIIYGDFEKTKFLINNKEYLEAKDSRERTPLHIAIMREDIEVINLLIHAGCSLDSGTAYF